VTDLSQRFPITHETVNPVMRRRGIPLRTRGVQVEQVDEAERLYRGGPSLAAVASVNLTDEAIAVITP
jgi:hypothetical protein